MYSKIFYFLGVYIISSGTAAEVPPTPYTVAFSALSKTESKIGCYDQLNLQSRLKPEQLGLKGTYQLKSYVDSISLYGDFKHFIEKSEPLGHLQKHISDELRYQLILDWAFENNHDTWDNNNYFPTVSTNSIKNVYIPLAYLLLNGFREGEKIQQNLLEICSSSLSTYQDIALNYGAPDDPKVFKRNYLKQRFRFDRYVHEEVTFLSEDLKALVTEQHQISQIRFAKSTKKLDRKGYRPKRIGFNNDYRKIIHLGETTTELCTDIIKNLKTNKRDQIDLSSLRDELFIKYKYLADFAFDSIYAPILKKNFMDQTPFQMMKMLLPCFNAAWDKLGQETIFEMSFEEITEEFYALICVEFLKVCDSLSFDFDTIPLDAK